MKIKCLIVDDEQTARQGLNLLCSEHDLLEVVGVCKNGMEAIEEIKALKPNLVLLDIQMPRINGFEVLASIPSPKPQVIFITAHDEFAIKAFEVNALDYLLKPFSDERFDQAIARAVDQIQKNQQQNLSLVINTPSGQEEGLRETNEEKMAIKVDGSIHVLNLRDISHVEAFDYYVKIHTADRYFLIRETMKNMETRLDSDQFMRVHKSYIVNKSQIQTLQKTANNEHELTLKNTQTVKVSRSKVGDIKSWITE